MIQWISIFVLSLLGSMSHARTNSYFTMTGDRVLINIQAGNPMSPSADNDAVNLYKAMNVSVENSLMGKGKKIDWKSVLTMIVADRGNGRYDGTIMVYQWPGIHIDYSRRVAEVRWTGAEAAYMFDRLNHENGSFDYSSADGRLKIHSEQNQFLLTYQEYM